MFLSNGVVIRHPLTVFPSLRRVVSGGLPRVQRYYEGAVSSCYLSRRTSLPSFGGTPAACGRFAPIEAACTLAGLELYFRSPPEVCTERSQDLPCSCGTPIASLPCSSTPAGPCLSSHNDNARCGPRIDQDEGTHEIPTFEAQSHGFNARCLRFAARVTPLPRKTRFRPLAKHYRTGFSCRVPLKGFRFVSLHHFLLSQAFMAQGQVWLSCFRWKE